MSETASLRTVLRRRPVVGWAFYDWANSAFATTVMAGFFPVFYSAITQDISTQDSQFYFNLTLAAAFVIATGMIGTMLGPWLMDRAGIHHPLARGLALGTISHGQGTAQAVSEGEKQGAIAGIAMGVSAVLTSVALPSLLQQIL